MLIYDACEWNFEHVVKFGQSVVAAVETNIDFLNKTSISIIIIYNYEDDDGSDSDGDCDDDSSGG